MKEMRRMEDMTNHYYSERPRIRRTIFEQWAFELKGKTFQFVTDSTGVFSRETVDYGSRVLIDAFDWERVT